MTSTEMNLNAWPVREVRSILLTDRTTRKNIIFATDSYADCTAKVYMNQSEFKYYTLNNPNTTTLVYRNRGNPHIL